MNGGELARQLQCCQTGTQILANLAGNFRRVLNDRIQRLILVQPLRCRFRADLVDARNVVRAVAHQRQVVDDLFGIDIELGFDALTIHARVAHGVDQHDVLVDELRHVFVAGGNQHAFAACGGAACQRTDHVVGLNAGDAQQCHTVRCHRVEQRLNLHAQIIRHRRAVRFVLGKQLVAKSFSGRVKDHGELRVARFARQLQQHVQYADHRAGRLAA